MRLTKKERDLYRDHQQKFDPKFRPMVDTWPRADLVTGLRRNGCTKRGALVLAAAFAAIDADPKNADLVQRFLLETK